MSLAGGIFEPSRWARAVRGLIGVVLAALVALPVQAQIPGWQKRSWGQAEGAPGMVLDIARTPDGYLWLAAVTGLYRFDGRTFARVPRALGPPKSEAIGALMVTDKGELWVGHDWGGVSVLRDGVLHSVGQQILHGSTVRYLRQEPGGQVAAFAVGGGQARIWRLREGQWRVTPLLSVAWLQAVQIDRDGVLWLVADGRLRAQREGDGNTFEAVGVFGDEATLTRSPDGRLWIVSPDALRPVRLDDATIKVGPALALPPTTGRQQILFDDDHHFWRVSRGRGVERFRWDGERKVTLDGWTSDPSSPAPPLPMVGGATFDRERNLWVSATQGVDQYRPSAFKAWSSPISNTEQGGAHFVVRDGLGDVFIIDRNRVLRAEPQGAPRLVTESLRLGDIPCGSAAGGVWRRSENGFERIGGPAGKVTVAGLPTSPFDYVHCREDAKGALWFQGGDYDLGYVRHGVARRVDLREEKGFPVLQLATQGEGVLAYVGNGAVWRGVGGEVTPTWRNARDSVGFVEVIFVAGSTAYFGGAGGLARFDGARMETASAHRWPFLAFVGGMAQTPDGVTWLHNADGLVGLKTSDLDRVFRGEKFAPTLQHYGFVDGLVGANPFGNQSSLAADRWGRVWVATTAGVSMFDPRSVSRNRFIPPVHITAVRIDDRSMPTDQPLKVGADATRITLAFDALSLAAPEHNRFRYRLEGVDRDWIEADSAREVTYSNLGPGRYRFMVIAANNDGVWNAQGASLAFSVAPAFYQTWWFLGLVTVALAASILVLFRLRLARLAAVLRAKELEREDERERISRELHDTLLQGVQGLILSVDAAARQVGPKGPGQNELQGALGMAETVMEQARERVRTLRLPEGPQDLKALLARQVAVANLPPTLSISLSDQGWRTPVTPIVAMELAAIAGEALTNIMRHAGADAVQIVVARRSDDLVLSISDDGVGFPDHIIKARRRDGHFGLVGMAERARRIGARLSVQNHGERGGLIEISMPAEIAAGSPGVRAWWRRLGARIVRRQLA